MRVVVEALGQALLAIIASIPLIRMVAELLNVATSF